MVTQINLDKVSKEFFRRYPNFLSLGEILVKIIKNLLQENGISYVSVEYRIKNIEHFLEKIKRKKYKSPFEEMEDICGIRIICYFQRDIAKIEKILKKEFDFINNFNKQDISGPNEFGYRSNHLIIKVKDNWKNISIFKPLFGLKAEIQIRTILMHAWAEIEHKLAYKKQEHIPKQFRRKFARISAKLEEVDEQFEELIDDISNYKKMILRKAKENKIFDQNTLLNLDTLQSFFDYYLPLHQKDIKETRILLDKMLNSKIDIKKLIEIFEEAKKAGELKHEPLTQTEKIKEILNKKKIENKE